MTAKNRTDIQSEIDSLLADNVTGDISPSDERTVHETSKDSNLNLLETTAQTVAGLTNYTGGLKVGGVDVEPLEKIRIDSSADWPTPVSIGGVSSIRLEGKHYVVNKSFSMTTPLAWPGVGLNATIEFVNGAEVTYTGTDSLFKDPDAEGEIDIIGLTHWEAPNGKIWDVTASTGAFKFQSQAGGTFTNCNSLGIIDGNGVSAFILFFTELSNFDLGLDATDMFFYEVSTVFMAGNNVVGNLYFKLQGAGFVGSVNFNLITFLGGSNTTLFDLNTNIQAGVDSINFTGCRQQGGFSGTVFAAGSLTEKDTGVLAAHNAIIGDTVPGGLLSLTGNTTETIISAVDTPTLVAGAWVVEDTSQMTGSIAGRLTYDDIRDITRGIDVSISVQPASGNGKVVRAYVAKNGTEITNSGKSITVDNGKPGTIPLFWREDTSTTNFYEVFVENKTDAINIIAVDGTLRIP